MAGWCRKRQVMRKYDRFASAYDAQYTKEQNGKMVTALRNMQIMSDDCVLDLGCGTGLLFKRVANRIKLLVGLDVSAKILKEAKKRANRFPNVSIIRADADLTPFPDGIFDAVLAITLLQNMPKPLSVIKEMRRISKPHALIVITGLRKEFTLEAFLRLLNQADLKVIAIETNKQLKGYVANCRKTISN